MQILAGSVTSLPFTGITDIQLTVSDYHKLLIIKIGLNYKLCNVYGRISLQISEENLSKHLFTEK